jgi:hypothetical protein
MCLDYTVYASRLLSGLASISLGRGERVMPFDVRTAWRWGAFEGQQFRAELSKF